MKKLLVSVLVVMLSGTVTSPLLYAETVYGDGNASLDSQIIVPNGWKKISVSVTDESVRSVLHGLSGQSGFNLVMDESVTGNVTVELTNVTINEALQAVAAMSDIMLVKQSGNIVLAISREAAQNKGIARQMSKVIKIYYANATRVADTLNRSIFAADPAAGGASSGGSGTAGALGGQQTARPDSRTNSVIIVGTARQIELAEVAIAKMDIPRQSKTFYLSHANALDVATMLASSIFNDGTASFSLGAASGASGSGGAGGVTPSTLRVERQDVQEGTGISSFGGSGGSSSGGVSSGLSATVTLRGTVKTNDTASISPEGALVIPDTRQNAITIMGTAEQIAMAESLIPTLDAQLPQVAIEASLVEITETGVRELENQIGISDGRMQSGFNNSALAGQTSVTGLPVAVQPANTGLIGLPTVDTDGLGRSGIMLSTNPLARNRDYVVQLRNLMTKNKARVLANPTVVATHDSESIISIVDEIVRGVTTELDDSGFATRTINIGEAGIVLDILPRIGEDGTVSMRLRPSVTSVLREETVLGNQVTLLSKRDMLTQSVRVRDGETLIIGGLIHETDIVGRDQVPGLGNLPIVGAMFRASQKNGSRSELVLLITPHILNKAKITPVNTASEPGGIVETSLTGGTR